MAKNWQLDRRTFLRGLGTAMALPMLDAMAPSLRSAASASGATGAAAAAMPKRMAFIYVPNGANMADWTPSATGSEFELPMILQPLQKHQRDLTVITGLAQDQANAHGDGGGGHARASATFLTGCHPRKTAGADIKAGVSVDQIAAQKLGEFTRLPSLELSCDGGQRAGSCDSGYSCAYQFNLSWRSETQPMMPEVDPRLAFERLFGTGNKAGGSADQLKRRQLNKSVLDFVLSDAKRLQARLGTTDHRKMDEYLNAVREIEQRIERAEKFPARAPDGVAPPEMFETYEQHVKLMFDMLALAFQTDTTRVATFIVAHEGSNRPYPQINIRDGHHDLSHHRNEDEKKALIAKINRYHVTLFAEFLEKMKAMKEGEGNVLDNSMIVYGSGLSDGNGHVPENLPVLLAGRGGGTIATGRHLRVPENTPMTNLYLSMLDRAGVPADRVGDSTGRLEAIGSA